MKPILSDEEVKKLRALTTDELTSIDCKSIKIIQEVTLHDGLNYLEPLLIMTDTNSNTVKVNGYDNIVKFSRNCLKLVDSKKLKNEKFSEEEAREFINLLNLVKSKLPEFMVDLSKNGTCVDFTRLKDYRKYSVKINKDELIMWSKHKSGITYLSQQLVSSVKAEFANIDLANNTLKPQFYFNGVFWTGKSADKDGVSMMTPEEVLVMFENTVPGAWNADGEFENREDVRTWISEESLESLMLAKANVDKLVEPVKVKDSGTIMMGGLEFKDISDEDFRIYEFESGKTIKIKYPTKLNVSKSGGHRILDNIGFSHYVPAGWVHLWWKVKPGKSPFAF